jgi:hypothetical protein
MSGLFGLSRLFPNFEQRARVLQAISLLAGLPENARGLAVVAIDKAVNAPGQAAKLAGEAAAQAQNAAKTRNNKSKFLAREGNAYRAANALGPFAKNKVDRKTRRRKH